MNEVQHAILDSPQFKKCSTQVCDELIDWYAAHRKTLEAINADTVPNDLIVEIGEDLLARFKPVALLDEYAVYEQLMAYWHEVIHDDVFLIMHEGWRAAAKPRKAIEDKDRKLSETADITIGSGRKAAKYKTDLIPPALIVCRYFSEDQTRVAGLHIKTEEATLALEEYIEEHAAEDGLLAGALSDEKLSRALAAARLKEARDEDSDPDEIKALEHVIDLCDAQAVAKKAAKEAQAALDHATLKKYGDLTETEVKSLVVEDKWKAAIMDRVLGELNADTVALVDRIEQLNMRYRTPIPSLEGAAKDLSVRVMGHLKRMGFE